MSDSLTIKLSGDCTLRAIRTLHGEIAAALGTTPDLVLDCAEVERADIAFVQLVVAAAGTAERQAGRLALADASEVVRSAFARAGLTDQARLTGARFAEPPFAGASAATAPPAAAA